MGKIRKIVGPGRLDIKRLKLCVLLAGCAILMFLVCKSEYKKHDLKEWNDYYLSVEEAAQMLSFTAYDADGWEKFLDCSENRELKYIDVKKILEHLGVSDYITYHKKGDAKVIGREEWNQIYEQLLELLDTEGSVSQASCLIFGKNKEEHSVQTQDGTYVCHLSENFLQEEKAYLCYIFQNTIIGIRSEKDVEAVLPNVYLKENDGNRVTVLFSGQTYEFSLQEETEELPGMVCDLHWKNGEIIEIDKKQEMISGNLLTVDEEKIEIDGYGQLKRAKILPVYKTYGTVEEKSISDIVIGNMDVTYVVAGDEVCAILLNQPANLMNIRVLLLNDDGSVYREGTYITCDGDFNVVYGENTTTQSAGTVFDVSSVLAAAGEGYVRVDSESDADLFLTDASGKRISYGYDGCFEVRRYDEGFVVINDVSIENYLYQVVTSEMPASYQLEALKAQAVCARSYAYRQLLQSEYARFGAHVDDSTNYQVYNKQEHTQIAKTVVDDTCGEVMECNGEIIEAFYFSTSCGMTENDCVWNNDIPDDYPFLKVTRVSLDNTELNLADETAFYNYITSTDESCFDASSHYFRWNTSAKITEERMEQVRGVLTVRKEVKPENILIYDSNGNLKDSVGDMGKLRSMQIKTRGTGGAVLDLTLFYEKGHVEVLSEYNIRKVLGCLVDNINLCDGTKQDTVTILPSAYFTFVYDETNDIYTIYGGGYGHGVGMSQNGAEGMAQQGYNYKDILSFFFQNITIQLKG